MYSNSRLARTGKSPGSGLYRAHADVSERGLLPVLINGERGIRDAGKGKGGKGAVLLERGKKNPLRKGK